MRRIGPLDAFGVEVSRQRPEKRPRQIRGELYLAFSKSDDWSEPILSLISLDASLLARTMGKMPPEAIRLVHRVLSADGLMGSRPNSLEGKVRKALAAWAERLGSEIGKVETKEYYQRTYFRAISQSLKYLADI